MTSHSRNTLILMVALLAIAALMTHVRDVQTAQLPGTSTTTAPVATSTANIAASTTSSFPTPVIHTLAPAPVPTPAPAAHGMITPADNGKTVHYSLGTRFGIAMGDTLDWTLDLSPQGIVTRVTNIATIRGEQGVYTATARGTTVLTATGAPRCEPGQACPQFMQHVGVTIVVD